MSALAGKIAVITGSTRGIGRAIAQALTAAGAQVVVTGRQLVSAQQAATELNTELGTTRATGFALDVSQSLSVTALTESVVGTFGRVDILVNNAGISPMYTRALRITEADFDAVVATNLKGTFLCCQAFGQLLCAQGSGCVVNLSSVAARAGSPRLAAYSATKAGVEALTRTLALEWAEAGVRVNAVAPAFIETDLNVGLREIPKLREAALARTPLQRFGQPHEVAEAVVFLCSDAASYLTGTVLDVDGGWLAV